MVGVIAEGRNECAAIGAGGTKVGKSNVTTSRPFAGYEKIRRGIVSVVAPSKGKRNIDVEYLKIIRQNISDITCLWKEGSY